ncbi:MAG: hypothetical protein AAF989_17555, partial [Planctomycetota bacterium]
IDNADAKDWQNSIPGQLHLLPGETGTLGIALYRADEDYSGPEVFSKMRAKPNGHRQHWRKFDVSNVTNFRMMLRSTTSSVNLGNVWLSASSPYQEGSDLDVYDLPYLDALGQVRSRDWEGEANVGEALPLEVISDAEKTNGSSKLNVFGGWRDGPRLEATGWFRVAKHEGRWWLVDPEGWLFWSNGINAIGAPVHAEVTDRESLFEWLPDQEDPQFGSCYQSKQDVVRFDFRGANLIRRYGSEWEERSTELILARLNRWGFNTAGAWSSPRVNGSSKIPYTPVAFLWVPKSDRVGQTPDPFSKEFRRRVRLAVARQAEKVADDPWCLGIYVGNEIAWPEDLVDQVLKSPGNQPARVAFIRELTQKYGSIRELNGAWGTDHGSWDTLTADVSAMNSRMREDLDDLYELYADMFFRQCRAEMRQQLPNHLYLGARVHVCPESVAKSALESVDVFSLNYYSQLAGVGNVPLDADFPILLSEYHFGALD